MRIHSLPAPQGEHSSVVCGRHLRRPIRLGCGRTKGTVQTPLGARTFPSDVTTPRSVTRRAGRHSASSAGFRAGRAACAKLGVGSAEQPNSIGYIDAACR
jgi:hypothetical protein